MKPGKELDLLIAKVIFDIDPTIPAFEEGSAMAHHNWVERYSTDIGAAWKVVEKMRNDKYRFKLEDLSFEKYQALFFGVSPPGLRQDGINFLPRRYATSDTAPHAICLAALKAKGVDI